MFHTTEWDTIYGIYNRGQLTWKSYSSPLVQTPPLPRVQFLAKLYTLAAAAPGVGVVMFITPRVTFNTSVPL